MRTQNRRTRVKTTAAIAAEIKRLATTTDLHQHQIAALLGINQGRVSEVLRGRRFADIPPSL
jgi:predicted XRE-type DNA-binding protein